ncbi:transglutaminase-like domain-containing protein [Pseudactinotalea sp.]|uniref:transglutaminase-like domain-containing protein n=1 Tax=Pseudactinotalea sp. TaxID=1926260 RepID=UPI003B3BD0AB
MTAAPATGLRARPRNARPAWRQWFTTQRIVGILVPVGLIVLALAPLHQVYLTPLLWVTVAGGALLGTALATAGAQRRWPTLTVLAFALPTFFLFGALAAPATTIGGVLPTLTTWQLMGVGMVTVWKQVLTIAPPLGTTGVLLLLPYLLAFFGSLIGVTISLRAKRWSLSLLVPAVVGVVAILFGTRLPVAPGVVGVAAVAVSVMWVAWRSGRLEAHRVIAVPLVLGLAAVGGTATALLAVPDNPRLVLRDFIDPPPDPHDYTSPLASFRRYVDTLADETLLTATGLPAGTQRIRLATMDSYDGHVWGITGSGAAGTGTFTRPGERLVTEASPGSSDVRFSLEGYTGVWLPTLGASEDVDFTGGRAGELTESFYFNRTTDTGLVAATLRSGDGYRLVADPEPDVVADDDSAPATSMLQLPAARIQMPEVTGSPDIVASLASQYTQGATGDYERVSMIATALSSYGYFSHGLEGDAPSRPGHGAARLVTMLDSDQMTGDAEQYAAAMALMVRELGLPARVVMGFDVSDARAADGADGGVAVTGSDVTAWVEVPFEGHGWLPFFPTPEEDQVPQVQNPDPQDRPEPQVLQPPEPPQEPPVVPPLDRSNAPADQEGPDDDTIAQQILLYVAMIGIPLLVLLSPFIVIAALKARRWRRRRSSGPPDARIAGGWAELSDRVLDLGIVTTAGATRREASHTYDRELAGAGTVALARRADAGVFAPEPPSQAEIDDYWADVATAVKHAGSAVPWRRRLRGRFSLRSLRSR